MSLLARRCLVQSGKGGVGKSTVTAALALVAASQGKRVLVCEVNSKERIAPLLGLRPVGEQIGRLTDRIDAVVVRPQEAMREYAIMKLKYRAIYAAVFENRFVARFLRFVPSLPELVMLGKILFHVKEGRWDLVLVDAPATGHGITLLRVPQAVIDTVPAGPMRDDAEWMRDLLVDPAKTLLNLVSLPEELPVNETIELHGAATGVLGMRCGMTFLNRTAKSRFAGFERDALSEEDPDRVLAGLARAAHDHERRADRTRRYGAKLLEELELPLVEIPFFTGDGDFGRLDVDRVAEAIAPKVIG